MPGIVTSEYSLIVKGRKIRNRTVLAAMTNKQSNEDGTLSDEEVSWLLKRAEGGFGIVTTAASHVHKNGKSWEGEMGVWSDHHIPRLQELASGIRERGALGLVQIFHGGLRAPRSLTGEQPASASINFENGVEEECRELSGQEIEQMVVYFGEAASRCERAGFDGVEIHGAHGYLICQFLGAKTNRRKDKWGGGLKGRSLFLKEVIREIAIRTSDDFVICVRISPEHEVGVTMEESLALSVMLREWGVDMLHISCWDAFTGPKGEPEGSRTITNRFREVLGDFPLISTGSVWTEADAEFVLGEGADLVGVARVGIAHSDWASRLGEGDYDPSRPPFSSDHLLAEGLSPVFIDYMRRWKGFVDDGRK